MKQASNGSGRLNQQAGDSFEEFLAKNSRTLRLFLSDFSKNPFKIRLKT
jgi:hypothetical protein